MSVVCWSCSTTPAPDAERSSSCAPGAAATPDGTYSGSASTDIVPSTPTLSTPVSFPRLSVKLAPSLACALLRTTLSAALSPPSTSSATPEGASMRTVARSSVASSRRRDASAGADAAGTSCLPTSDVNARSSRSTRAPNALLSTSRATTRALRALFSDSAATTRAPRVLFSASRATSRAERSAWPTQQYMATSTVAKHAASSGPRLVSESRPGLRALMGVA
mmetsp:Transcript_18043/g.30683  ORF Transcript_18043/g.30683 Transcript_18043/m.30683 type:complete len:222 (+) Transcript_18043:1298-1963(+)